MVSKNYKKIEEMAEELGCHVETVKRMIGRGELPEPTVGRDAGKTKAWHLSVLEVHALKRLGLSEDVRCTG